MQTRRQLLSRSALLATVAALGPLLPLLARGAEPLRQRAIPATGEMLPVIGLGTSRTHDVQLDDDEMRTLLEVLRVLVEGGARVIDTAPSYGNADRVVGELVQRGDVRRQVFLASKVSATGRERGVAQIEKSFEALQTGVIDLIQVHNLQDTRTQLQLLRTLKEQGRIRYIGVTHYVESAHDRLLEVLKQEPVDFVQFNYSVSERNAERRLLPYCAEHGIATLINRPFTRGNLLSRVKGKPLPGWAADIDASSWAQLLLKFILAEPAVTTVIPATSNPRYMADNLMAGQGRLPDARQREMIVEAFR
ncbi:MAG TPA: aldo/keto reductase [Pseudomonas sp.]|jgi:diketogulonate reductase-like aldo/keto reductase|uniref:aldo/keto reductase n=1 Tax=Stutzerimonas xanthomarina TaxID=271420 RepID=UPI000E88103E|nr:aldo/keto reductase [Stutzerimonas xanthomarina]MBU0813333.1 aldo/keto reductase [Gammaproteobacteria bacterium]HAQ88979.1 aldo/keto reductase [Pseudomonas sp.]MBK3849444.1 aldo/keto reductase [Stutzerimonas xanthomarina]MBU0850828.1 aldo/keto reductase [Gammaproteobacteria bacterium]MBU1303475.1 aldo/keto reductase [Gammaproteobacteria bacterium]|tara:strand:+ start:3627 stop:4544 length:918 start_codon:yes stop_codon:yes gene_type:complete